MSEKPIGPSKRLEGTSRKLADRRPWTALGAIQGKKNSWNRLEIALGRPFQARSEVIPVG